jgi:hypothetical protein
MRLSLSGIPSCDTGLMERRPLPGLVDTSDLSVEGEPLVRRQAASNSVLPLTCLCREALQHLEDTGWTSAVVGL